MPTLCNRIIRSFANRPTLRQLFYVLVSKWGLANNRAAYNKLSLVRRVASLRRDARSGGRDRSIYDFESWESMAEALEERMYQFQYDRDRTQDKLFLIGCEKNGMRSGFIEAFSRPYGIPASRWAATPPRPIRTW